MTIFFLTDSLSHWNGYQIFAEISLSHLSVISRDLCLRCTMHQGLGLNAWMGNKKFASSDLTVIIRDPNERFTGTDYRKVMLRYHFVDSAA